MYMTHNYTFSGPPPRTKLPPYKAISSYAPIFIRNFSKIGQKIQGKFLVCVKGKSQFIFFFSLREIPLQQIL